MTAANPRGASHLYVNIVIGSATGCNVGHGILGPNSIFVFSIGCKIRQNDDLLTSAVGANMDIVVTSTDSTAILLQIGKVCRTI
jgi:hypothetical protein